MSTRRQIMTALASLPLVTTAWAQAEEEIAPISEAAARIISYTIYGEARGETFDGKLAVASVIHTRSELRHCTLVEACLEKRQFACWNGLDAVPQPYIDGNGLAPADAMARGECYRIAWLLLTGEYEWDFFTHFYNPDLSSPYWAAQLKEIQAIGRHLFGYIL